LDIWEKRFDPVNRKAQPMAQSKKSLGKKLPEVSFILVDFW
jgi:hypothetical protein